MLVYVVLHNEPTKSPYVVSVQSNREVAGVRAAEIGVYGYVITRKLQ